jgi:hypothetical protein
MTLIRNVLVEVLWFIFLTGSYVGWTALGVLVNLISQECIQLPNSAGGSAKPCSRHLNSYCWSSWASGSGTAFYQDSKGDRRRHQFRANDALSAGARSTHAHS